MTATLNAALRRDESLPLSKALKQATILAHEEVDAAMMALAPFEGVEGYRRFLVVQYHFHHASAPLYRDRALAEWFGDLNERCRYQDIITDCCDLGIEVEGLELAPPAITDPHEALGWLYTNEGSNLGAAILFKRAVDLGLSAAHGARHLAERGTGRAGHWREFVAQLDAVPLTATQREQAVQGACNAFAFVRQQAAAQAG